MGNSTIRCLKSLSPKFDATVSSENSFESIKVIFLLKIMLIYLSVVLRITSIFTLKWFSSLKIKCPSCSSVDYEK